MISRNYSEKISFVTFFPLFTNIFTNAPGLPANSGTQLSDPRGMQVWVDRGDFITFLIDAASNQIKVLRPR